MGIKKEIRKHPDRFLRLKGVEGKIETEPLTTTFDKGEIGKVKLVTPSDWNHRAFNENVYIVKIYDSITKNFYQEIVVKKNLDKKPKRRISNENLRDTRRLSVGKTSKPGIF